MKIICIARERQENKEKKMHKQYKNNWFVCGTATPVVSYLLHCQIILAVCVNKQNVTTQCFHRV